MIRGAARTISSRISFLFPFKLAKMHRRVKKNSTCFSPKRFRKNAWKRVTMIIVTPICRISHRRLTNFTNCSGYPKNLTNPRSFRLKINSKWKLDLVLCDIDNKRRSKWVLCRIDRPLLFYKEKNRDRYIFQLNRSSLQVPQRKTCILKTAQWRMRVGIR